MTKLTSAGRGKSRKVILTSLSVGAVLAVARPAMNGKVFADPENHYDWVKQTDLDKLGGYYTSAATSADGSHIVLGVTDGGESSPGDGDPSPLFISDDYGANWTDVSPDVESGIRNYWTGVDISDDGQTIVAVSYFAHDLEEIEGLNGRIHISEDGGSTWDDITPSDVSNWTKVAISGDASNIVALSDDERDTIYTSTNGGTSWQTHAVDDEVRYWQSVSISDNGDKIMAGGENPDNNDTSMVYYSANGGTNWEDISPDDGDLVFQTRTAMSADGNKLLVSSTAWNGDDNYDAVYVSTNGGDSWTDIKPDNEDTNWWEALAMSDDGQVMSVADNNGNMFVSSDAGDSWLPEEPGIGDSEETDWHSIDLNEDGSRIVAATSDFAFVGSGNPSAGGDSATLTNAENGASIKLTTPNGTTITCSSTTKESAQAAQDGTYSYPLGLVDFCFSGADENNEVSLTFVTNLKPDEVLVRKYNPDTKKYTTVDDAEVSETTMGGKHALLVTYNIVDNGPLDMDPDDGEVADPVGLAVAAVNSPDTGYGQPGVDPEVIGALIGMGAIAAISVSPIRRKAYGRISKK